MTLPARLAPLFPPGLFHFSRPTWFHFPPPTWFQFSGKTGAHFPRPKNASVPLGARSPLKAPFDGDPYVELTKWVWLGAFADAFFGFENRNRKSLQGCRGPGVNRPIGPVVNGPVGPVVNGPVGPGVNRPIGPVVNRPVGPGGRGQSGRERRDCHSLTNVSLCRWVSLAYH